MTLALAQVVDTDCVASTLPLVLRRMPGKYVAGAQAVLRRVLYAWVLPPVLTYDTNFGEGLPLYEGTTLAPSQILALRCRLEHAAKSEDFVLSASVPVALVAGVLQVPGVIVLVDGLTYPLEVTISQAGAALRALGL